ncbi:hypothetical protein LUZ60_016230 [Juncus effusus]|nr:hypothetical protein LUZ60_016230 [Juncus effusus]
MCEFPIYPGVLTGAGTTPIRPDGFKLKPGDNRVISAPPNWSSHMWDRYSCKIDSTGKFSCDSGDCASGQFQCNQAGAIPPVTLVEFTLHGADGKDFYDISNVDGFNLPVSIVPSGGSNCQSTTCATNINYGCPQEFWSQDPTGKAVGCKSACLAFNTDEYCCRGAFGGPQACKATQAVRHPTNFGGDPNSNHDKRI